MSSIFFTFNGFAWVLKSYLKSETIVNYKPSSPKEVTGCGLYSLF